MTDIFRATELDSADIAKLKIHLERIRQVQNNEADLVKAINEATTEFNKFFLNYRKPSFVVNEFKTNATPQSEEYNESLETLRQDIEHLYESLTNGRAQSLTAYNYATVTSNEITNTANELSSRVLDLNIINNFIKGTVIVAGDDFVNGDNIDTTVGVESTKAELLHGGSAVSLQRVGSSIVSTPDTKISITPVLPAGSKGVPNTAPTPKNIERFYEGQFYANMGEMRPAGGYLNINYMVDPSKIPETSINVKGGGNGTTETTPEEALDQADDIGYFAVLDPSDVELAAIRSKMLDGDPSSFWECEYVYQTSSFIDSSNVDHSLSSNQAIQATQKDSN
jgi:hypothetical protein